MSNGAMSPAVYCKGNAAVKDADLSAYYSEAACLEGLHTLELYNVNLLGDMPEDPRTPLLWNVLIYQTKEKSRLPLAVWKRSLS